MQVEKVPLILEMIAIEVGAIAKPMQFLFYRFLTELNECLLALEDNSENGHSEDGENDDELIMLEPPST